MRSYAALVLAAACYAPSPPAGAPCDPQAPSCPSEQRCVAVGAAFACEPLGVPAVDAPILPIDGAARDDASRDATSLPDTDGDGVPDVSDNCPAIANADQHDEDADGRGDVCDPCPPIADGPAIIDSDGDGVADACDPHPSVAGDRIVIFEPFDHGVPAGWTTDGTWTASGDDLAGTTTVGGFATATVPQPAKLSASGGTVVTASFTVTRLDGASVQSIAVVNPADLNPYITGAACELHANTSGDGNRAGLIDLKSGAEIATAPFPYAVGDTGTLAAQQTGTTYTCTVTDENGVTTGIGNDGSADAADAPVVGIRLHGTDGRFGWFMVVAY